jgi:hypothetical protein
MAFLDNSGDIILDAVLTDTGRKRLADGTFSINQFGLGDDEINYGTYDLTHPSGSAYYDLEIMQTPVFESTTAVNSNINYGLLNIRRTDLLYLPVLEFNEKFKMGGSKKTVDRTGNMFYLAVNAETSTELDGDVSGFSHLQNGTTSDPLIIFESGLNTDEVAATANNRTGYLVSYGLVDGSFNVNADSRFITQIGQIQTGAKFYNILSDNELIISIPGVLYRSPDSTSIEFDNFNSYRIGGTPDLIYEPDSGDDNKWSALRGPRGTVGGVAATVVDELATTSTGTRSRLYTDYGVTNSTVPAASLTKKYDYIDTTLFVQGNHSGASLQIPLRIIRYVAAS